MWRILAFLLAVAGLATALAVFADRPGGVTVEWLGYRIETTVLAATLTVVAAVATLLLLWSALRFLVTRPGAIARHVRRRREERGLDALSRGMIAVGAGDTEAARRCAAEARRLLPHAPLTALLRAQAAELAGDRAAARHLYAQMAERKETELLGLRGLYLEAMREQESEAARQFAARAVTAKPALAWGVEALLRLNCQARDWAAALETLDIARRNRQIDRAEAARRRAVVLTAQAMEAENGDLDRARELAREAHRLAPDLVPAAVLAGRLIAAKGYYAQAARVLARTWRHFPQPDLARTYAFVRPGDSPRDRLKRARTLAQMVPGHIEGAVAVATAAIEARDWAAARQALAPHLDPRPPARVCLLMARIEAGEHGDAGRVREWLARAVRAPRDPAWVADGLVSQHWLPAHPTTGALDAFQWRPPPEAVTSEEAALLEVVAPAAALTRAHGAQDPDGDAPETTAIPSEATAETAKDAPATATQEDEEPRPPTPRPAPDGSDGPRLFVPPRAPDDPGPEPDPDEADHVGPAAPPPHPPRV